MELAIPAHPQVIALDVNETLSDMSFLDERFERVGARAGLRGLWFASTLRDGFALTAAGGYADFRTVAHASLQTILAGVDGLDRDAGQAAGFILDGMAELPLHPDVAPGLQRLHSHGIRLVTLTNGAAQSSRDLLARGGVAACVEQFLSVADAGRWKPAPQPYLYAAGCCGVAPAELMLVAVHPWDIHGAKRAGLMAAWINRGGERCPNSFETPDLTCPGLDALADSLVR